MSSNRKRHQPPLNPYRLARQIKKLGIDLGFTEVRIAHPAIDRAEGFLKRWQQLNNEGEMHYLQRHGLKRGNIRRIQPDCVSLLSVSLNYLSTTPTQEKLALAKAKPYVSVYARNRDYHKVMRTLLKRYAKQIEHLLNCQLSTRAFVDTAPVLDKAYAEQSGLGWMGKHTNILDTTHGSFYFLGELALNIKLPADPPIKSRCGSCRACIDVCPTQAIIAPYHLDAERCISYLTIEYDGVIADPFKKAIGNRIYGCDDCQLFCPWNRYAKITPFADFHPRDCFNNPDYVTLFQWDEPTFLQQTEGSPIRRIGHNRWQRNLAIGIGNALSQATVSHQDKATLKKALQANRNRHHAVIDAIHWALHHKDE